MKSEVYEFKTIGCSRKNQGHEHMFSMIKLNFIRIVFVNDTKIK